MSNDPISDEPQPARPNAERKKRPRWPLIIITAIVLVPALLMTAWMGITLNWSYSKGDRPGFLQKFSQKGWICKTWEGELSMINLAGQAQEKWAFTVRSDSLAKEITKVIGQHVAMTYEEHRGVPGSCFGDTRYFVTAIKVIP